MRAGKFEGGDHESHESARIRKAGEPRNTRKSTEGNKSREGRIKYPQNEGRFAIFQLRNEVVSVMFHIKASRKNDVDGTKGGDHESHEWAQIKKRGKPRNARNDIELKPGRTDPSKNHTTRPGSRFSS